MSSLANLGEELDACIFRKLDPSGFEMGDPVTVVVGGGPAGATCAWRLASEGGAVQVLDRSAFPRPKVCAGALGNRGAELLIRAGIMASHELESQTLALHRTMSCWFRYRHLRTHDFQGPPIRLVDRSSFDALLLSKAREAGACVLEGEQAEEVTERKVRTSGGMELSWDFLVGADGVGSLVGEHLAGKRRRRRCGVGIQARLFRQGDNPHGLHVHFGLVPWGYGWIFPGRDHILVGIGGAGRGFRPRSLGRRLSGLLKHAGATENETLQGAPLPSGYPNRRLGRGSVYLAGDAAGLVDRISGEGIAHAVESGLLVAEAILRGWSRRELAVRARRGCVGLVSQSRIFAGLLYHRSLQPRAMRRLHDDPKFFRGYWNLVAGRTDYWRMMLRFLSPRM